MDSIEVKTFGCKVNTYDSGLVQQRLKSELPQSPGQPVVILNSCAVTSEATKQVVREARRIKKNDPETLVVVTGCSAQVDTEVVADSSAVDLVVANSHKGQIGALIQDYLKGEPVERVHKSNIFKKDDLEAGGGEELGHTRSFLKIQDGCDSFCTFCVIPFARGKSRSIEPDELSRRIRELETRGFQEVVLTGVHIGDYQGSKGERLEDLVEHVLANTTIQRIRLSSLEPIELSDRLIEIYKSSDRLCRHFHMSIQSASTTVLQRMKRHYSAEQVTESLEKIAKHLPDSYVGMDVIAGFPQESEDEFAETYHRLCESAWTRMHVFPYSARPNTYAARALQGLSPVLIKSRAEKLRELSHERLMSHAVAQIGKQKHGLFLRSNQAPVVLTRDYWTVQIENAPSEQGPLEYPVQIIGSQREISSAGDVRLYGRVL